MLISSNRPYPYNLIEGVFHKYPFLSVEEPPDLKASVEYLLLSLFDERKQKILHMRFKEGKTLQYVGDEVGISKDRVRQIEDKMLSILRKPKNSKIILNGIAAVMKDEINEAVRKAADSAYLRGYCESQKQLVSSISRDLTAKNNSFGSLFAMTIDNLGLTVRSYNCLHRAGIETIEDLMQQDAKSLSQIRNLGVKSYKEIIEKLEMLGLNCEHLKDYAIFNVKRNDGKHIHGQEIGDGTKV